MRHIIVGAAMVLAITGVAVAKDKKATVAQADSCSASHLKAGKPKLDCKSTGTVSKPSKASENMAEPRLGYGSSPWFVPSSL
jgi:hypothetical protein